MKSFAFATAAAATLLAGVSAYPTTGGQTWKVKVGGLDANGNATLTYDPPFVSGAMAGDQILFEFHSKNHTVTRSSFDQPCTPYTGPNAFDTGFNNPVDPTKETDSSFTFPTYQVTVTDPSTPIWVYCKQTVAKSHCAAGMVFAINPPATGNTYEKFVQNAEATASNSSSGSSSATDSTSTADYGYGSGSGSGSGSGTYTTTSAEVYSTEAWYQYDTSVLGYDPMTMSSVQPWETVTVTVSNAQTTYATTYSSYEGSPQPTYSPSGPVDHKVTVGLGGLVFSPSNISAAIGDTVTFEFHPKAHSLTQSTFADPCTFKDGGIDTDLIPVADNVTSDFPTRQIVINGTDPLWFFCKQQGPPVHCGQGMVFSVNAVEDSQFNFLAFQARANATRVQAAAAVANGSPSGSTGASAPTGSGNAAVGLSVSVKSATGLLGGLAVLTALL